MFTKTVEQFSQILTCKMGFGTFEGWISLNYHKWYLNIIERKCKIFNNIFLNLCKRITLYWTLYSNRKNVTSIINIIYNI